MEEKSLERQTIACLVTLMIAVLLLFSGCIVEVSALTPGKLAPQLQVPISTFTYGTRISDVAITPDGGRVYVGAMGTSNIFVIDT